MDDRFVRLLLPHLREGVSVRDLLGGRIIGESQVPGYRPEDRDG